VLIKKLVVSAILINTSIKRVVRRKVVILRYKYSPKMAYTKTIVINGPMPKFPQIVFAITKT